MTSASELFYHRRSRSYWRNSVDQGFAAATASTAAPSLPSSPSHHHRNHHRHRCTHHRDLDDCDSHRNPLHAGQLSNRLSQIVRPSSSCASLVLCYWDSFHLPNFIHFQLYLVFGGGRFPSASTSDFAVSHQKAL